MSGYVVLGANLLYTMASVPLALHYLGKEEFGLWALIMQLAGYFAVIDFGMSGAVARILADHKDDKNQSRYGEVLKTGALVFTVQGLLIATLGVLASWILPDIMAIPQNLKGIFETLLAAQCVLLGLSFCVKILASPLWCHQRSDIVNALNVAVFAITFVVLWLGFHFGLRLYSMLLSNAAGIACTALVSGLTCFRLGFFPKKGCWGQVTSQTFREVFGYAKNLFLIIIGTQLLTASQVVIVTRTLGLDAAAVWSIATKAFTLAQQMIYRICDYSIPALVEMFVRKEIPRLKERFQHVLILSGSLGVVVAATVAVCNGSFLALWTGGRIAWSWENDVLMALVLVLTTVIRCHNSLLDVTKDLHVLKYVSVGEGVFFIPLATFLALKAGFAGIIAAAGVLEIAFLGFYGVFKTAQYFQTTMSAVLFSWIRPVWQLVIIFIPLAVLTSWSTRSLDSLPRFLISGIVTFCIGLFLLVSIGLTSALRDELFNRFRRAQTGLRNKVSW